MSVVSTNPVSLIEALPPRVKFTREAFHEFVGRELQKGDRRFELVEGDILEKMSQKEPHVALIMQWIFALARVFGEEHIRNQGAVVLSEHSEVDLYGWSDRLKRSLELAAFSKLGWCSSKC